MGKFTNGERHLVKSLIATLSIKRIPDNEIIKIIFEQTNKMISERTLYDLRQSIKKDSYQWYKVMREGQNELYLHEFKERINEIMDLQKRHHDIIDSNKHNPQIQQTSLAELHKLNITLANYFDVAPEIINGSSISKTSETKTISREESVITV